MIKIDLLTSICWSNAYPVLVFLYESKGEINLDELEILLNQDKIDILERIDFLKEKGLPIKYDKNLDILRVKKEV
ncbi:MAG: hypothetical protein ACFFDH_03340 [Promethearchaeota archaeon]